MRVICQKEKLRKANDLTRKHRAVSIYATWALVKTGATADQVTTASIVTGLMAAALLAAPGLVLGLLGVVLLYVSFLLDQVDGEVARYWKRTSLRGVYLDELRHLLVYSVPVFALSFDVARASGDSWPYAVGFVAALGLALARIEARLPAMIFGEKVIGLMRGPVVGPVERSSAFIAPGAEGRESNVKVLARRGLQAMEATYDVIAHQVLLLAWFGLAVAIDRGAGRVFGGVGLEGLLIVGLAVTTTVALVAAIAARVRAGELERDVGERVMASVLAARGTLPGDAVKGRAAA